MGGRCGKLSNRGLTRVPSCRLRVISHMRRAAGALNQADDVRFVMAPDCGMHVVDFDSRSDNPLSSCGGFSSRWRALGFGVVSSRTMRALAGVAGTSNLSKGKVALRSGASKAPCRTSTSGFLEPT